ncbi:MAG TPA: hypothetical protein VFK84_05185 [Burkholderiales bacterium]|nr:hypothetical protein [Burkholderiales bacterium]
MESMPKELQGVPMPDDEVKRALTMARPTNQKVREAADARLRFEDEPATYLAFLNERA